MSEAASPPSERVRFAGPAGQSLAGRIDLPDGPVRGWAVLAHCFTCGKDLRSLGQIAQALARAYLAALRFDFTGVGESGGDFGATTLTSHIDDVLAAVALMRGRFGGSGLLFGHSLGGAVALLAALRLPEVRAVATLAAPSDTTHFRDTLLRRVPGLATRGEGEIELGGGRFRITRRLLDDLAAYRVDEAVSSLGRPLLVMHSPTDRTVAVAEGEALFARARQPKSFISLDGADHLLLARPGDARHAGEILAAWAGPYMT